MYQFCRVRKTNRFWHNLRNLSNWEYCTGGGSRRRKETHNFPQEDTLPSSYGVRAGHRAKRFTARPPFNAEYRKRLKKRNESSLGTIEKLVHGDLESQHARLNGLANQRAMHAIQNIQRRSFVHFLKKTWPEFRWIMQPRHITDGIICLHEVPEVPRHLREDPAFSDLLETFSSVLRYQSSLLGIADIVQSYSAISVHPVHSLPAKSGDIRRELLDVLNDKLLALLHLESSPNYVNEKAIEQWLMPLKNRDLLLLIGNIHEPLFGHLHCLKHGKEHASTLSEATLVAVYQGMLLQLLRRRWYHRNDRAIAIIASSLFRLCYPKGELHFPSNLLDRVDETSRIISQVMASEDIRSYDPFVLSVLADVLSRCGLHVQQQLHTDQQFFQLDSSSLAFMKELLNEIRRRQRIARRRDVELLASGYAGTRDDGTSIEVHRGWTMQELIEHGRNTTQGAPARQRFNDIQTTRIMRAFDRVELRKYLIEIIS